MSKEGNSFKVPQNIIITTNINKHNVMTVQRLVIPFSFKHMCIWIHIHLYIYQPKMRKRVKNVITCVQLQDKQTTKTSLFFLLENSQGSETILANE